MNSPLDEELQFESSLLLSHSFNSSGGIFTMSSNFFIYLGDIISQSSTGSNTKSSLLGPENNSNCNNFDIL